MSNKQKKLSTQEMSRHGLRFELARVLLQHGAEVLDVAERTGLDVEQIDLLLATDANEKERAV